MSDSTILRLAMPALTILFAALAAAAWLVPVPYLTPKRVTGVNEGAPPFTFAEKKPVDWSSQIPKPEPKDWNTLVAELDGLWDKPAAIVEDKPPEDTGSKPTAPLAWTYSAYAGTSKFPAAFVNFSNSGERVLYVNDTLPDEFDPQGARITVIQITPEEIVVSRGGREERIKLATRDVRETLVGERPPHYRGSRNPAFNPMNQPVAPPGTMIAPDTPGVRPR